MDEVPSTLDLAWRSPGAAEKSEVFGTSALPLLADKQLVRIEATFAVDGVHFNGQHKPFPFLLLLPTAGLIIGIGGFVWLARAKRTAQRGISSR